MADTVISILSNNPDKIMFILEETGFRNIKHKGNSVYFAYDDVGGNGSCVINVENLLYKRFSTGEGGKIFDAIMSKRNLSFPQSVGYIKSKLGIENCHDYSHIEKKDKNTLFGGIFNSENKNCYKVYNEYNIPYKNCISELFLKDNICAFTQVYFDNRYDPFSERIVVTWKDINGNIVGFNKRANFDLPNGYKFKYITEEGFVKNNHLYGLYENKDIISKTQIVVVVESEKSVQQAFTFGYRNIVALGSSNFSEKQLLLLIELGVKNIVLAYDEGSDYLKVKSVLDRFEKYKSEIGFYFIKDYSKFKLGSKDSPTDNGKDFFIDILTNCLGQYKF